MTDKRYYVPFFILVATALAVLVYYYGFRNTSARYVIYSTDSVHGMVVTAPVEYSGVTVGEVSQIELAKPGLVKIVLAIKPGIPITMGTRARIISRGLASRGFTGYIYVLLEGSDKDNNPLVAMHGQTCPVIPTLPSQGGNIDLALFEMKDEVNDLAKVIESTMDKDARRSLKKILANMEQITNMLLQNNKRLNTLIINTEKASFQFSAFMESGTRTMMVLETQILPEVYQVLAKANILAQTADNIANSIERDPSVVLRGTSPPARGPGE